MKAFSVPPPLVHLRDPYPNPRCVVDIARRGGEQAQTALARLWLSEGIPSAFRECPAVYEAMRFWLSTKLEIHTKEIGLVGSARLGRSLAPKKLGQPFSETSDLDFFTVSKCLFEKLSEEFCQWSRAFENGEVTPKTAKQKQLWPENHKWGRSQIRRKFLDHWKVPNFNQYPTTMKISHWMWVLVERLKCTPSAPSPIRASVRCYVSWDSFIEQTCLNFTQDAYKEAPPHG